MISTHEVSIRVSYAIDNCLAKLTKMSDPVVVTGFWRSGTTWTLQSLAKILERKTVFEPLNVAVKSYKSKIKEEYKVPDDEKFINMFMPYVSKKDIGVKNILRDYIGRSIRSSIEGEWIRKARRQGRLKQVQSALRKNVVTKFVRGQLLHSAMREWFDPLIVHVRRDPRAIIPSFRHMWDHKWWDELSLQDQLLGVPDGRRPYFKEWQEFIKRVDKYDEELRLIAYWALTEKFVEDNKKESHVKIVSYEKMCREGGTYIKRKIKNNVEKKVKKWNLYGESAMTKGSRKGVSVKEKIEGWKKELEKSKINKIEKIVREVGLDNKI